jgi:hypothetical protein
LTAGGVKGTVAKRGKKEPKGSSLGFIQRSIGCITVFHGFENSGSSHQKRHRG